MNRDAQALLDDLGLTHQHITFLGDVQVRDEDEIGRGSDAVVYKVNWQGIDIALKVLHPVLVEPGVQDRERKIRAFGQELFRLSRVHHPNLCQLIGLARVRGNAALALELLSASLEEVSIGDGREDAPKLVSYLCDASAGLRYLHSFAIIHRDLAPKNVLVKNGTAKVSDFGVAKFVRLTSPRQQQHQVQSAMDMTRCPGTLPFMPPEALTEAPDYDRPLDVFSLGVMMLSVLTGVMPGIELITAPHFVVVRERGQQVEEVIPETTRRARYLARLPDGHPLKPLIHRCLSNRPGDRPSAEQMHEEIKRFLAMFNSILPNQPSTAGSGVTRQLESISQQLSQQATCIADITARSSAVEDQLSTITQRLVNTQLETTAIRSQLQTTNQQVTVINDRVHRTSQQVTGLRDRQETTHQQVTEIRDRHVTTNQHVTEILDRQEAMQQQVTEIRDRLETTTEQVTSLQGHVALVASQQTDRASISEQIDETSSRANDQLSQHRSTLQAQGSSSDSGRPAMDSGRVRPISSAESGATRTTPASGVGENSRQHSAAPAARSLALTPEKIERIAKKRKWIEVSTPSDDHLKLITHQNTLVAVWTEVFDSITSIQQTTDMHHWTELPRPRGSFQCPSLASNGQDLYMYCHDNQDQPFLLQYEQNDRQWVKVAKVPCGQHRGCIVHATDTSVSLLGGITPRLARQAVKRVSCYTLLDKQWRSSAIPSWPAPHALPCDCAKASLVTCGGSLYIIGGSTGCFLQYTDDGHWQEVPEPDEVDLKSSLACSLSDDNLVITGSTGFWQSPCTVYNVRTRYVYDLPGVECVTLSSLALLNGVLVLSTEGGSLYTLDMNI